MRARSRAAVILSATAAVVVAVFGVAALADSSDSAIEVPEGPYIDFCPTTAQIEAHLEKYGFDYKPTVVCAEGGVEIGTGGPEASTTVDAIHDEQRQALEGARRAPDTDGHPESIEVVFEDGSTGTVLISTDDPERFRDITIPELVEMMFGEK